MISKNHPRTLVYFKSDRAIRFEERRHLLKHMCIIHPFSIFSLYWEFAMLIVYMVTCILTTITVARFSKGVVNVFFHMKIYIDVILTIDIVKNFFTGYYDGELGKTILKHISIAKKYLRTYFLVDFLNTGHLVMIILLLLLGSELRTAWGHILRCCFYLRILRIGRWLDTLKLLHEYANLSSILNRALEVVFIVGLFAAWLYTLLFQIVTSLDHYFGVKIIYDKETSKSFFSATVMLLHVSLGGVLLEHVHQIMASIVFMCFGYCVQLYLFTKILELWLKFSNAENKNEGLFQQFNEYLKYKNLPSNLKQKFLSFYDFKFQNQFYNEAHLNRMISKILKQEILVCVTKKHVQRVEFFKDLPDAVLSKLVARLKSEIFLAGDIILKTGSNCMFFIYFGTVAIYSPAGKEICHLEDGAHFGEIALIFNEPRVATVKAVTPCELFVLNRSDFLDVLKPYPDIKEKIILLAQERLMTTGYLMEI
ncbi:hypothetical protein JTB14_033932 [Gonioctena quinquepunctata]|nr:hypothetical protein JTB14_033932 [Gonioctena quinquepunctata]